MNTSHPLPSKRLSCLIERGAVMNSTTISLNDWLDDCLAGMGLSETLDLLDPEFQKRLRGLILLEGLIVR